jgi:hypothetical protein
MPLPEGPMPNPLTADEAKALARLCEAGRLYEIEAWIRAGKSLAVPPGTRKTPMGVAMATGFHSLVELLLRHEADRDRLNAALLLAVQMSKPAFIDLALRHGAQATSVPFVDVLMTGDRTIAATFLERGADPVTGHPFANAMYHLRAKTLLGSYLDCRRTHPDLANALEAQADMALRQFCDDGNLKWVSLMLWAGANPRSIGPTVKYADDPEMATTALDEACVSGNLEILKRLKPDARRDDVGSLLRSAALFSHADVVAYLLDLGADANARRQDDSTALETCLRHITWEDTDRVLYRSHTPSPAYKLPKARACVRLLIERGAKLTAGPVMKDIRQALCKADLEVTLELVTLLLKHAACDDEALRDLFKTPPIREHVAPLEARLLKIGVTLNGKHLTAEERKAARPISEWVLNSYDREKLYREVWAKPARDVARQYSISDVRLGVVCRILKIPKPPRGYWAKKAAGLKLERRPRLPPL